MIDNLFGLVTFVSLFYLYTLMYDFHVDDINKIIYKYIFTSLKQTCKTISTATSALIMHSINLNLWREHPRYASFML